jgi:hypothetical protein
MNCITCKDQSHDCSKSTELAEYIVGMGEIACNYKRKWIARKNQGCCCVDRSNWTLHVWWASFSIDVYYSKVLVGQTQHLCMDALNRRAKRHQFWTFSTVVFIEAWRSRFRNDKVSLACTFGFTNITALKCWRLPTEHCGALRWSGGFFTVLEMLNATANLCVILKSFCYLPKQGQGLLCILPFLEFLI